MKFSIVALLGAIAVAYAEEAVAEDGLYVGPLALPDGVDKPAPKYLPKKGDGPPGDGFKKGGAPVWHPGHPGIDIDDCDDEKDDWHWAQHKGPKKPAGPPMKWTVSTVTATKVETVIDCPDKVPSCPGKGHTKTKTITVDVTTTICPVPITEGPPGPTKPAPPGPPAPGPTKPATTPGTIVIPPPPTTTRAVVTAGAAVQKAGGALAAVAAVAAIMI